MVPFGGAVPTVDAGERRPEDCPSTCGRPGERHIDGDLAQQSSIGIENLDAPIAAIGHIDVALRIGSDAVRRVELAGAAAGRAPLLHPVAILVEFGDARIDVAITDEDVALRVPGDVGGLAELAVDGGKRRPRMLPRLRSLVGRFLLAPEDHLHAALGIELDHHVRAFVDGPKVIVFVEADGVREGPGVEIMSDFANVISVRPEFENLRGGGAIGGAGGVAARKDEDMILRVHGHARGLTQIQVGRKLEEIGNRLIGDFGDLCPAKIVAKRDRQ